MIGISKRFPGTVAVDGVDLSVAPGEVHALLGENGAGKSTLVKVLAGGFPNYSGEIRIDGKRVDIRHPGAAKAHGISMIHQELSLSPSQSIAENMLAGRLPTRAGLFVDRKAMARLTASLLARVGMDLDPATPVERLSQHEAQLVEIARALGSEPRILIMDEPTSALTRDDVGRLFGIIGRLKEEGLAVIYISHHLFEVFEIADRASVLRDGKLVGVREIAKSSPEELARMMVGRESPTLPEREGGVERSRPDSTSMLCAPRDAVFVARGLSRKGFFAEASFSLRAGEIVGLCGLAGSGRTELARSICGIDPLDAGELEVEGRPVRIGSLRQALENGVAYVTEDRKQLGLALRLTLRENVLSALIPTMGRGAAYASNSRNDVFADLVRELRISPPDPRQVVRNLSGGNQQKALLAKWLATKPRVLILDEPTRGVDVGAKALIHESIAQLAGEGTAILLISSDFPELIGLSHRFLVMRRGRLIAEILRGDATEESLLLAANGGTAGGR